MTFTPTPRADLTPIPTVADMQAAVTQQLLSRLADQEAINATLVAAVADLYARANMLSVAAEWLWTDSTEPGPGEFHVTVIGGDETDRHFALSVTDADGGHPFAPSGVLAALQPGRLVVILDEPAAPPITAFRQYAIATQAALMPSTGVATRVEFYASRLAVFGPGDVPIPGTRIRVLLG